MPYRWLTRHEEAPDRSGASLPEAVPLAHLQAWPFRSLPRRGFVLVIGSTATLLLVPLLAVLGSPVLWGLLPFLLLTIWGLWFAINRNYRDAEIVEDLTIWPDRVTLLRRGPRGRRQSWEANPHWVSVSLHAEGGPVPHYLTLRGGGRLVELGAFLSEEERIALTAELRNALSRAR